MEKGQLRQVILKDKNLKNVHTVSNMLRTLQTHIVKRLAKAFKEWNNYIILKKIIDKEKSLQITRKLESFIFSVCQDVRDLLDSDRCSLWLMDVESQKLWAQHFATALGLPYARITIWKLSRCRLCTKEICCSCQRSV